MLSRPPNVSYAKARRLFTMERLQVKESLRDSAGYLVENGFSGT